MALRYESAGRVGQLRHRVKLEQLTAPANEMAGTPGTWQLMASPFARIRPISGIESITGTEVVGTLKHEILMRHQAGVDSGQRIIYGERVFEIDHAYDIDERGRWTVAMCTERPGAEITGIPQVPECEEVYQTAADQLGVSLDDYEPVQHLIISSIEITDQSPSIGTSRPPLLPVSYQYRGRVGDVSVAIGAHPLAAAESATMVCWVKPTSIIGPQAFISGGTEAGGLSNQVTLGVSEGYPGVWINGEEVSLGTTQLPVDQWSAVAAEIKQVGAYIEATVYVDGEVAASGTLASATLATSWPDSLWIAGTKRTGEPTNFYNGFVADVWLFSAILPAEELQSLMMPCVHPAPALTQLAAHWSLEERDSAIGYDSGSAGAHLRHGDTAYWLVDDNVDQLVDDAGDFLIGD